MKIPDSPPPEREDNANDNMGIMGEEKPGMGKFEQLMKAAVSIKTAQLDQKKRKFEKLPTFLKAGLYYSNKLEVVRSQSDFHVKLFAFEIIRDEGAREFALKNYDRACRKFEEVSILFHNNSPYSPCRSSATTCHRTRSGRSRGSTTTRSASTRSTGAATSSVNNSSGSSTRST